MKPHALILALCLVAAALLHAYWAFGGQWGLETSLGGLDVPPVWLTLLVALLLIDAALIVMGRVGFWGRNLPPWYFRIGTWVIFAVMCGGILANISDGTFLARAPFIVVFALLAWLAFNVARSPVKPEKDR